jgi:hypothetical protein
VVVRIVVGAPAVRALVSVAVPGSVVVLVPVSVVIAIVIAVGVRLPSVAIVVRPMSPVLVALSVVTVLGIPIAIAVPTLAWRARVAGGQVRLTLNRGGAGGHALIQVSAARTAARSRGQEHENARCKREDAHGHDVLQGAGSASSV